MATQSKKQSTVDIMKMLSTSDFTKQLTVEAKMRRQEKVDAVNPAPNSDFMRKSKPEEAQENKEGSSPRPAA
jgi:hypothetical protein